MGRMKLVVPVLLCTVYGTDILARVDPLVETNVGLIRGLPATDGEYYMFLGIPYATVNASNPFGLSIPVKHFVSTFNAYDDSAICPQRSQVDNTPTGTLDCLQLSVYVPFTATSKNPLPVLVWIHGGGYIAGSGNRVNYDPKFLVRHNVIVVTLNYRLGAYGWMCLDTPEVPGNQGLRDQLTALRWVKNNIDAFGGDVSRITIFGNSAGAVSVDLHLYYSQENLFNNVIVQSGTALAFFGTTNSDPSAPIRLSKYLGHDTKDLNNALNFLSTIDTDTIVAATSEIELTIRACIEKEIDNVEPYVTGDPNEVNISNVRTKPVLIGFNSNEFGINFDDSDSFVPFDPFPGLKGNSSLASTTVNEMLNYMRRFYTGIEDLSEIKPNQLANFRSDFAFVHPTDRSIRKYLKNGAKSVYYYVFAYDGKRNTLKSKFNTTVGGALHFDELGYLFDMEGFTEKPSAEDQLMIDRITTMWTNFAKYSHPTPQINALLPVQWPSVTTESTNCLNIDSELTVQEKPFHSRIAFWDVYLRLKDAYSEASRVKPPAHRPAPAPPRDQEGRGAAPYLGSHNLNMFIIILFCFVLTVS